MDLLTACAQLEAEGLPIPAQQCDNCGETIWRWGTWFQCPNCGAQTTEYGGLFTHNQASEEWRANCAKAQARRDELVAKGQ